MPRFKTIASIYRPTYKLYRKEQYAPSFAEQGMGIDPNRALVETDDFKDILNYFGDKERMIRENPHLKEKIERIYKSLNPKDFEVAVLQVENKDLYEHDDFRYKVEENLLEDILC